MRPPCDNDLSMDLDLPLTLAASDLREGQPESALRRVRAALPDLEGVPDRLYPARALEARALAALGRGEEALELLERSAEEAASAGLPNHEQGLRGLAAKLAPDIEMARLVAIPVERIERDTPDLGARAVLLASKAMAHLARAEHDVAAALLPLARGAAEFAGEPAALVPVLLASAHIHAAEGAPDLARGVLAQARALAAEHAPDALALLDALQEALEGAMEPGH
jgi:hypothetical protein